MRAKHYQAHGATQVGGGYNHNPFTWVGWIITRDQFNMTSRTWTCRLENHHGHPTKSEATACAETHIAGHCDSTTESPAGKA